MNLTARSCTARLAQIYKPVNNAPILLFKLMITHPASVENPTLKEMVTVFVNRGQHNSLDLVSNVTFLIVNFARVLMSAPNARKPLMK